jgi:hypothetical protein
MVSDWFEQGKTPIWHHTDQRHLDQATEQIGDLVSFLSLFAPQNVPHLTHLVKSNRN